MCHLQNSNVNIKNSNLSKHSLEIILLNIKLFFSKLAIISMQHCYLMMNSCVWEMTQLKFF